VPAKKKTPSKKPAAKKTTKAKPKSPSKASLVKSLKDAGLTVPEGAEVKEMEHRLKYYNDLDSAGYNVRLYRGWGSQYEDHPIAQLVDRKAIYWLPPSAMAEEIVRTKLVVVVKRGLPLHNATVIDVPVGYGE